MALTGFQRTGADDTFPGSSSKAFKIVAIGIQAILILSSEGLVDWEGWIEFDSGELPQAAGARRFHNEFHWTGVSVSMTCSFSTQQSETTL